MLLIGTPNIESDGVASFGDRWLGFNPFHIYLLSRKTLHTLLERTGFKPLTSYSFGNVDLGQYPALSPLKQSLRDMAVRLASAKRWRARRAAASAAATAEELTRARTRAVRRLAEAGDWQQTEDGTHPRAAACRGDNLVVIARRHP